MGIHAVWTTLKGLTVPVSAALLFGALAMCADLPSGTGEWRIDMVDASGVPRYTSMKIDARGNAHVAYVVDDGSHTLKYSFWDHELQRWFTMKVGEAASFCALALDSKQRPHISFHRIRCST